MAKKNIKTENQENGLFGNVFDLNGDGKTDDFETALMLAMFDQLNQEEHEKRTITAVDNITDLDDLDIEGI